MELLTDIVWYWKGVKKYWSSVWRGQHWFDGVDFSGCLRGWSPCNWVSIFFVWSHVMYIFNLLKSTYFCLAFVCRVIPKTLMPREVMLRCFGSISLEIKRKTKHICRGTHRIIYMFFPILAQYKCPCSNPLASKWISTILLLSQYLSFTLVLFCDSCAVPSEWNYSQTSHILFIYYPWIHLAIWGLPFWTILSFSPSSI